jgi:hypothetical protein
VLASFERPGLVDVKIDVDLTPLLASPEAYGDLAAAPAEAQRRAIEALLPQVEGALQLWVGGERLRLIFQDYRVPALARAAILDPTADHFTLLQFVAALPAGREPIRLVVKPGSRVAYPVAFIMQIPAAHISEASWIQDASEESDRFDWAAAAPRAGAVR